MWSRATTLPDRGPAPRGAGMVFLAVLVALVLLPLTLAKPGWPPTLKADEAAYLLMARSLWEDGDLQCEIRDVARLFDEFPGRSRDLFLMSDDGWRTVYFGKPFPYSLLVAPAVALFGANGMLAVNAALFLALVALGTRFLRRWNPPPVAALFAAGFFFLSPAWVYVFWLQPEVFLMAAVGAACYLAWRPAARSAASSPAGLALAALSGAALATACYHKPMLAPLGLALLVAVARRQGLRPAAAWLGGGAVTLLLLGALAIHFTGHPWVYVGVPERAFDVSSPDRLPVAPLPLGGSVRAPQVRPWSGALTPARIGWNRLGATLRDFLLGRHVGLVPYQPFAVLAVALFLLHRWRSGLRWLLLACLGLVALAFILWEPSNWHGGGGFVGNRYFVTACPAFLFLVTEVRPRWVLPAGWGLGGLLLGPLLFTVFGAPVPAPTLQAHARNAPLRLFPFERAVRGAIPGYRGMRVGAAWFRGRRDLTWQQDDEIWLRGAADAELLLKRSEGPEEGAVFLLRSLAPGNHVRICLEQSCAELTLEPGSVRRVELEPDDAWEIGGEDENRVAQYRLTVSSTRGRLPRLAGEGGGDFYLGVALTYLGSRTDIERDLYGSEWRTVSVPERIEAGARFTIAASVVNTSRETWPSGGATRVRAAYHWLDVDGNSVVRDGWRTELPRDVAPGETVALDLGVEAPSLPGRYTLELDLVRERVAWFAARRPGAGRRVVVEVVPRQPRAAVAEGARGNLSENNEPLR